MSDTQLRRLQRQSNMMTARGVISATDDTQGVHKVQVRVTPRETVDAVPVVQLYGISSHAKVGSEAHLLFVAGDRSRAVVVATNDADARVRNLQPGEVALFTDEGDVILLGRNHHISITTTGDVTINAPTVNIRGQGGGNAVVNVTGDIHATGTITADTMMAPHGHVGP